MKYLSIVVLDGTQIWSGKTIIMDQIQSNNCTYLGSNAGQLVKEAGDHDAGLSSTAEDTPKCFPRLFRKILMLASLCLATVQMIITQSMIAPFYPQEVSWVSGGPSLPNIYLPSNIYTYTYCCCLIFFFLFKFCSCLLFGHNPSPVWKQVIVVFVVVVVLLSEEGT